MSYENLPKNDRNQIITAPIDYQTEVSGRRITGSLDDRIVGRNSNIGDLAFETLWDQGGDYTYLTADTQLYASSSSASDTAVLVIVSGLDFTGVEVTRTATVTGQTQVALSGLLYRVHAVLVGSPAAGAVGEIYLAESDTLTAGVPDTVSKIKSKIALDPMDSGDYASFNITHNGFFTVPAGKNLHVLALFNTTEKNCDITVDFRIRAPGGAWLSINRIWAYQSPVPLILSQKPRVGEMSDIEVRVLSGNPSGAFEANLQFNLVAE